MARTTLRVGLTGGIGSGKSTVAAQLSDFGIQVIDADQISRASTAVGGAAIAPLRAAFGAACITPAGALDRGAMRTLVFNEPAARTRLEGIVHPLVEHEIARQVAAAERDGAACVVVDIPLLIEHLEQWRDRLDHVVVVDCEPETQLARVAARDHLSPEQIRKILQAQASRAQRLAAADTVIENGSGVTPAALRARVRVVARMLAEYHSDGPR